MKLVILDRDGVINADSENFIKSPDEWVPIPGALDAIARLTAAGYRVAVATNQSGLSRGLFGLDELEAIHHKMCTQVEDAGGLISAIFYCPHLPDEHCTCRKPAPGMLDAIARELDCCLAGVAVIGDSLRDLQAAIQRDCAPILVRTGKGTDSERALREQADPALRAAPVYDDLAAAVDALLGASFAANGAIDERPH